MKLILDVPEPKFSEGTVVQWNDLVLHLYRVMAVFPRADLEVIVHQEKGESTKPLLVEEPLFSGFHYYACVQAGTALDSDRKIRPGTCLSFGVGRTIDDSGIPFEEKAQPIEWDKTIIKPDTYENIGARLREWDSEVETE